MSGSGRWRPSLPLVISIVALIVAVGGTATVGVAALTGLNKKQRKQVAKIANTRANKRISKRAPSLSVAQADSASSAENAANLGSAPASDYVKHAELALVAPTTLSLNSGWVQMNPSLQTSPPSAYKDQLGYVHLLGLLARASGSEPDALVLPAGLRPGFNLELPAVCDEPGPLFDPRPGVVFIYTDGRVSPISSGSSSCTERLSLDGISFPAGG